MKNAKAIILVILLVLTMAPMMGCTSTIKMTGYNTTDPAHHAEPKLEPLPLPEPEPAEPAEPEPSPKLEPTPEPTPEPDEPLGDTDTIFLLGTGVCMPEPQCWYSCKPDSAEVTQRADLARYLKKIDSGKWDGSPIFNEEGWVAEYTPSTGIILTNSKKYLRYYTGVYPALKDLDVDCVAYSPGHETLVYAGDDTIYEVGIFADGSAAITPRYENVVDVVSFGEYLPEARFPDYYRASEAIKKITYRGEDGELHTVNWDGEEII